MKYYLFNLFFKISNILIDKKDVFVSSNSGDLFNFHLETGEIKWTQKLSSIQNHISTDKYLFVLTENGFVIAFNKTNGAPKYKPVDMDKMYLDLGIADKEEAIKLHKLRKETSIYIESELLKTLTDLELKKTNFKIEFLNKIDENHLNSSQFFSNGIDEVDFLITTNIGEPLKPLSKSASGGEMSRIMLGLKNLLVKSLDLSLIIFDEIDSGVSGYVASQVAKKMKSIS